MAVCDELPTPPQGVACGDVTDASAVIWTRGTQAGKAVFEVVGPGESTVIRRTVPLDAAADWSAHVTLGSLKPATEYRYAVTIADDRGTPVAHDLGTCTTAPAARRRAPVHFLVGGDVGGQGVCRHPQQGYPIFGAMADLAADFFVANGDMIYADGICPPDGADGPNLEGHFPSIADPSVDWRDSVQTREVLFAHWRYNRADPHLRRLLRATPMYVQWDDHEVVNDFGAEWSSWPPAPDRVGFDQLIRAGRDALFAYNPIGRHSEETDRIYRRFRWGQEVELFLLDARSYRDANRKPDGPSKTLLGDAQRAWLIDGLRRSDAIWKIISSDVPLSIPTGSQSALFGRDGFANGQSDDPSRATGFERELVALLTAFDAADLENVVFVVTDVHLAMTLRYDLDLDGDGDRLVFHELLSGPLAAGRFPTPPQLDATLRPTILYGEGDLLNFSSIRITPQADGSSRLIADVRDVHGEARIGSRLELVARTDAATQ